LGVFGPNNSPEATLDGFHVCELLPQDLFFAPKICTKWLGRVFEATFRAKLG